MARQRHRHHRLKPMNPMRKWCYGTAIFAVVCNGGSGAYNFATADYGMATFQTISVVGMGALAFSHRHTWMHDEQD